MFESLNRKNTVMPGINTEGMSYRKLKEFRNSTVEVKGFFFTNNQKSGEQVVVVSETCLINMPKRAVEQFRTIEATPEMLEAVLNGRLSLEVHDEVMTRQGNSTILYDMVG